MKKFVFILFGLFLMSHSVYAADFGLIGAGDLKKMIDAKKRIVIIDSRTAAEYAEGHIPASKNIPPEKLNIIGSLLPKDKNTELIIYCRGIG